MDSSHAPLADPDALLAEMALEGQRDRVPGTLPNGKQLTKIRYTHDAMIDLLVANPGISQNALAAHFGYTPPWISTIMATDLFQERLHQRREELVNPAVAASINERFKAVVFRSLEVLTEKLSAPVSQIPDNLALRAVELGAKGLAVGGFGGGVSINLPSPATDNLERLAGRLLELQGAIRGQRTVNAEDATIVAEE
jgi:hypothetical protein